MDLDWINTSRVQVKMDFDNKLTMVRDLTLKNFETYITADRNADNSRYRHTAMWNGYGMAKEVHIPAFQKVFDLKITPEFAWTLIGMAYGLSAAFELDQTMTDEQCRDFIRTQFSVQWTMFHCMLDPDTVDKFDRWVHF